MRNAPALNNIPVGQAPAIIIALNNREMQSVNLVFDGSILTTIESPSAFRSIALLLSGYWVFHLNYPSPYVQHLETFEAILHNRVEEKAKEVGRYNKMSEFFMKYKVALTYLKIV